MSDPYLYPGTTVLINHFNIKDQAKLDSKERRETLKTLKGLYDNPVKGEFALERRIAEERRLYGKHIEPRDVACAIAPLENDLEFRLDRA